MGIRHLIPSGLPTGRPAGKVGGDDYRDDHSHVPFEVALLLAQGNTPLGPPASSALNSELFPAAKPTRNLVDLSQARFVRLVGMVIANGNVATATAKLQYMTTSAATWAGTDAGPSIPVGTGTAGTMRDSGWLALAAGAQIDSCHIACVVGVAAYGTTPPTFGSLTAFFR